MKILYLMHVDWNWIKQRPHFIAEYMQKNGVEVELFYKKFNTTSNLTSNAPSMKINALPSLRGMRFKIVKKLDHLYYNFFLKKLLRNNNYDYVYLTHPKMYTDALKGQKIIYDCMDDCAEFKMPKKDIANILKLENKIIEQSYLVLFTAKHLADVVMNRCVIRPKKYIVNNNAIELPEEIVRRDNLHNSEKRIFTYIGTVSEWFDFQLLKELKENKPNIEINLYGPVDVKIDENIKSLFNFKGPVSHDKIFEIMNNSDVLLMPFKLNKLIESVNPVKLYEYIYSGKPILCVRYGESEKFGDAVYLYENSNYQSFNEQIAMIEKNEFNGKLPYASALDFVKKNTWENRVRDIIAEL